MSSNNQQVALTNTFRSYNSKVPMFLQKLYMIVDKEETNDVISWSQDGESFFVHDHERLAREHLPQWFKHNKFASFVRQLNMYGFHKVPHLQQGVLKSETEADQSQFIHPYFQRGKEDQLIFIERKKQMKDQAAIEFEQADPSVPPAFPPGQALDIPAIVNGIAAIRRHQTTISGDLNELKRSDQLLWEEALQARNRYKQQQDTINRIVKFLANLLTQLANPGGKEKDSGRPRDSPHSIVPLPPSRLMIEDKRRDSAGSKVGIIEVEDEDDKDTANSPACKFFLNHVSICSLIFFSDSSEIPDRRDTRFHRTTVGNHL
ncbi:HSF-type DNA-binding-domain-containing protein [Desarmillaria ectypa]|nr:HSF-type DNA-binding-domain-containing protein [Desarmillaria ectypa]